MRVLMLGWELPPHNSGGLGVACLNLAKRLASSGADIEFILPYTADHGIDYMKVTGIENITPESRQVFAYDSQYSHDLAQGESDYIAKVLKVVANQEFDVIHAHDWLTFRAAIRAKEKTGWPLIAHVHAVESDRAGGPGNPLVHEVEQLTFLLADRIVTVSEHTKQKIMREYHISADKITVVHNSINIDDLEALDMSNAYRYVEYLKSRGYKVISNIGRHTLQKGLPNFLHAAQQVVRFEPKVLFLLVGDGDQQNELIELAAELGISRNVVFTGFQRGKEWRDAFSIADLFVMPSISEPFGLTPLEAIAYGTPTLITKQSGVAEILHHTLKVDFWDIEKMADQMIGAIRSQTLRESLHFNAAREIESLSWQHAADKFLEIYHQHSQAIV